MTRLQSKKFASRLVKELSMGLIENLSSTVTDLDWRKIFAQCIGAKLCPEWDDVDVVQGTNAWNTKSIEVSGGAFGIFELWIPYKLVDTPEDFVEFCKADGADSVGDIVLNAWNKQVLVPKRYYRSVQTAVLVKGRSISEIAVFQVQNKTYRLYDYTWSIDPYDNMDGYSKKYNRRVFHWDNINRTLSILHWLPKCRLELSIKHFPVGNISALIENSMGVNSSANFEVQG